MKKLIIATLLLSVAISGIAQKKQIKKSKEPTDIKVKYQQQNQKGA